MESNPEICVREWEKKDINDVWRIEKESFLTPWSRISFLKEYKNPVAHYYLLTVDSNVIGFGGCWVLFDEAHITNLALMKSFRSKGYSNILLIRMMKDLHMKGVKQVTLEVREHNSVAQSLYKKYDFQEEGFRPKYYTDTGEGAILMWNHDIATTLKKHLETL